jgi:hypothetical protein
MSTLIVPVDVAALCVGTPDVSGQDPGGIAKALAPRADFSVLPYLAGGTVHHRGPYISATALADAAPFAAEVPLLRGIHLHWALPAGLSHAVQGDDGRQGYPAVPDRWLVTRVVADTATPGHPQVSARSWVIESDRLSATATAPAGLQQPTVPMKPTPGQNFRYLGASFDLPAWHEAGATVERLTPLTAVGYGEPAFAGFYPSSATSFGFYDALANLTGYRPATSTVSYHVAGWYAEAAADPLARGDVTPGANRYRWTWDGTPSPTATICTGVVAGIPWNPATAYLADRPEPLTVAVADTGPEALSALMASMLGDRQDSQGRQDSLDTERLLNALQFGLLSKTALVDSQPAFEEAMHGAGFGSLTGTTIWSVVTDAGPAGASEDTGGEVTLPDALADELNELNGLQLQVNELTGELQARRRQLFADWYKYLLVLYEPNEVPPVLRDKAPAVRDYLQAQARAIGAIADPGGRLETLRARVTAAQAAIAAGLARLGPSGPALALRGDTAAPPYREPADPVLLLSGADVTVADRHRTLGARSSKGELACRLDGQVVTGLTLHAGIVRGSAQAVIGAGTLPGLGALPGQAPAALLQALLREAIILAPALQPAVASACAALGGSGNPALLAFDALVAALKGAAAQFTDGTPPTGVVYSGAPPAPVMVQAWGGTPWLPLLLQYEADFRPLLHIGPDSGGGYPPGFVNSSFRLPADGVDLQYASGQPQAQQVYSGTSLLTDGTVADMTDEIRRFLAGTGNADPQLTRVLDQLESLPLLAQRLTGAVQAMLMQALVLQLPVSDPLASAPQVPVIARIAAAVADETSVAPLPQESFNPLRAGTLAVRRLRVVDAFGRYKDYPAPRVVLSSALRPPPQLGLPAGTAFLPPRITQPARLLFRWLSARDDTVETNRHPATTPVFGWLVPNWLDRALAIYDTAGHPLGELALAVGDTSVLWTPAPGGAFPPTASIEQVFAGQNEHLRGFALAAYGAGPPFLAPFFTALRDSLDFTLPAAFRESAETAVLAGQTLALARAGLSLEVPGGAAQSQSWPSFTARALNGAPPDDAGLSGVRFPVRLGGPHRLDDSLVGFWAQRDGTTDWADFYAPAAAMTDGGVRPPAQNTVRLAPRMGASEDLTVLTLLLDPRGSVHATSGVLPVEELTIPPEHYTDTIATLSLALSSHPALSASNTAAMSLALPKLSSGGWKWITIGGDEWQTAPTAAAVSDAALNYTPQQISEGWLVIEPEERRP